MKNVNPSFNIQATGIDFETAQLFTEVGPMGISLAILDRENCFMAVVAYNFAGGLNENELADKIVSVFESEKLFQQRYHKTHIFWAFTDSILVPAELMNAERNSKMLDLVFGDAKDCIIRSDFLYKHNLHNVYRSPRNIVDVFSTHLPVATQTHLFSTIVNRDMPEGNHLYAGFYSNSVTIMLCREGKLQVVQNFAYNNPADSVFHLLNVCKAFDVTPDTVKLHINGMIDEQSGLYDAIYKYFLNIGFENLPEDFKYIEAIKEYPPHFFSHLFTLAACV